MSLEWVRVVRVLPFVVAVALVVPAALPAQDKQDKPNFSGTWELDSASTQLPTAAGGTRGGTGDATTAGGGAAARGGGGGGGGGARGGGGGGGGNAGGGGGGNAGGGGGGNAGGGGGGAGRAPGRGFDPGPNAVGGRAPLGARGVMEAPPKRVVIRQTDTEITIGGTAYTLDGTGGEPTPIGRPGMKASWDGKKLFIQTIRDMRGTNVTQWETRTLSDDGKTMRIEIRIDTPQGEARGVQVYKKAD